MLVTGTHQQQRNVAKLALQPASVLLQVRSQLEAAQAVIRHDHEQMQANLQRLAKEGREQSLRRFCGALKRLELPERQ